MTSIIKHPLLILTSFIILFGCASEAKLGKADVSGLNAANATVQVSIAFPLMRNSALKK